jgi:hypothetical protein
VRFFIARVPVFFAVLDHRLLSFSPPGWFQVSQLNRYPILTWRYFAALRLGVKRLVFLSVIHAKAQSPQRKTAKQDNNEM